MSTLVRAIAVVLLACSAWAQEQPIVHSQSNLVLVPVQVRKHNQHVAGIDKDKFTILQDGKPQKVAVFEEVRTTTERLTRRNVGPQEFSNEYLGDPATARFTVIAIDRINTTTVDMQRLRIGLKKFLTEVAEAGEPIRLIAINPNSIEVIQDFTTDPKLLAMALQRNKTGGGPPTETVNPRDEATREIQEAMLNETNPQYERIDRLEESKDQEQEMLAFQQRNLRLSSLEALRTIAQSLAGLPGRKSLVWASSGYPFAISVRAGIHSASQNFSQVSEAGDLDEATVHLLNSANIAVYPVDARGMVNTAFQVIDPSRKYSPTAGESEAARLNDEGNITTFENLASSTGGTACVGRPDLSGCFKDAIDDSRDYYILGFYADSGLKPGWHKLQVKVAADASVRSRTGFIFSKLDPEQTRKDDMRLQLATLLPDPGVPFFGQWDLHPGDKKNVVFDMKILPEAALVSTDNARLNVDIAAVARNRDGATAGEFAQRIDRQMPATAVETIRSEGIHYTNSMVLPAGVYLVRIVVRDNNTGRLGSATTVVKVEQQH
ncbi:MAG: VWA domain-containing protein [Terriglobales bacterium]